MLARDIQTNKKVAAKKISFKGRENKPLFPTQVVEEINAMRASKSNNIPKLFEIFQDDHIIILTMEYIKGIFFGGKKLILIGSTLRSFIKKVRVKKKIAFCI
jgi:serine/threonine protein kinase